MEATNVTVRLPFATKLVREGSVHGTTPGGPKMGFMGPELLLKSPSRGKRTPLGGENGGKREEKLKNSDLSPSQKRNL